MTSPLTLLTLDAAEADAAMLAVALEGFDAPAPQSVSARRMGKGRPWRIEALFETAPGEAALAEFLAAIGHDGGFALAPLADEDWVARVHAGLPPIRTRRFFVRGAHVPLPEDIGARRALMIEAGLAFGTGHHSSTTGCLEALEALHRAGARPRRILDLGTGTGLLAFAAAHLWRGARILASDIDPVAVAVARENTCLNALRPRLRHAVAPGLGGPAIAALRPFDLVIANILAAPLVRLAPAMAAVLAPGGHVILAGLLDEQAALVAGAYRTAGLRLVRRRDREGWSCLVLARPIERKSEIT